eukprot:TRINITY_DN3393_c0_g1_i1.p1 TRINITY_DN3393_c0_g1~~TRINITY_DN3393_c0_g1_i1.p1  ORF type:complete len:267 (+),score=85.99 TRINITY_DN3393_c0_g1_i1:49-849(+)
MACLLIPFSGDRLPDEPKNPHDWQVKMCDSPCKSPCACCFGFWCSECASCWLRHKVLDAQNQWPHGYKCCQGEFPALCCFKPGEMGEADCPWLCLCLESWLCTGISSGSTYTYTMRSYGLNRDPWYNKFVRFNNFMQCLACLCSIAACFYEELSEAASLVRLIADFVFRTLMGCINAQVSYEVDFQKGQGGGAYQALPPGQQKAAPGFPAQQYHAQQQHPQAQPPMGQAYPPQPQPYGQPPPPGQYPPQQQYGQQPPPGQYPQNGV